MFEQIAHYLLLAGIIILPALAVAISQAHVGHSLQTSLNEQPQAAKKLTTLFLIAVAISETSVILCLVIGIMQLFSPISTLQLLALLLALAIPSTVVAVVSTFPIQASVQAIARQPFAQTSILNIVLLGLSMLQAPIIFGLIISVFIIGNQSATAIEQLKMVAAGLVLTLGSFGPAFGISHFSYEACTLLGRYAESYKQLITFVLMSQALIETPLLFVFIIGLLMFVFPAKILMGTLFFFAAACAMGLSTFGTGISSGRTAAQAARVMVEKPQVSALISRTSLIAQTVIDTSAIYGFIIAILILIISL